MITQGKWEASKDITGKSKYDTHIKIDHTDKPDANSGLVIAECYGKDRKGNAHLIAAAPDLLAALQTCYQELRSKTRDGECEAVLLKCEAAFDRAENN